MLRYHVRSRDLIGLVNDINEGKLIKSPYFQRNLVWRDVHKKDFIDTILLGLPFPQIFIAQGDIDVDTLSSRAVIVDGQQRMNSIEEFVSNSLAVNGRTFLQLEDHEKEEFLRYQVPVIDLDIKASDPKIIDIFKRLNRTFYALSAIEKMSTEYATVDLTLIAKYACGALRLTDGDSDEEDDERVELHPLMPEGFLPWASNFSVERFQTWLLKSGIFTEFEIARLVHLMFTLNLISTVYFGFFPRNDKTKEFLEKAEETFPYRDEILSGLERSASQILELQLPRESIWHSKSNAFTIFVLFFWHGDAIRRLGSEEVRHRMMTFSDAVPEDYALAAREAVNNRKQRIFRHERIARLLDLPTEERMLRR